MYNTDRPGRAELPSSARLWRSTIFAGVAALAILATIILPSEYGIDPTGVGRMLGLTQMGEIKMQLAREAEADRQAAASVSQTTRTAPDPLAPRPIDRQVDARLAAIEKRLDDIADALSEGMPAASREEPKRLAGVELPQDRALAGQDQPPLSQPVAAATGWTDEISYTLQPGEGIEFKLVMEKGAVAEFEWTANGAVLNHDTHGNGGGKSISYEKGRGVPQQAGSITAAFAGNHGWFWRNRTDKAVTLTLRTRGDYKELKRTV